MTRDHKENWIERAYTRTIKTALAHRKSTMAAGGGLAVLSLFLLPFIPISFLPSGGEANLSVQVTAVNATSRDDVLAHLYDVEAVIEAMRQENKVDAYSSTYGGTNLFGGGLGNANGANLLVRLAHGADAEAIAETLRQSLAGDGREVRVSAVQGGEPDSSDLELILQGEDYATLAQAANDLTQRINGLSGLVNVSNNAIDVADAPELSAQLPIVRVNGRQSVTISGTITTKDTQSVNFQIRRIIRDNPLPEGVELVTGGVFADINEAFKQMGIAMVLGVILVYAVMVVTQRSFMIPFIIVLSLPLAFIGAFGALFITQRALGLPALMGLLMLVGLVVTNAIVLIAFVEQLRARGLGLFEALVEGGRTRLRPILMTALTTTFVLLPMALGIGTESGGIIGAELATVVIGGLLASTFLTLVVIPVVYSFLRKRGPKLVEAP